MAHKISKSIFGAANLGVFDMGKMSLAETMRAASQAIDLGINTFDCADIYGLGAGEENLAAALGSQIQSAHIISKFGVAWNAQNSLPRVQTYRDCSPKYLKQALDASLRRLGCEKIDTYFVHWPDNVTPLEEIGRALEAVKKAGKIGEYGFSNFPVSEIKFAIEQGEISPAWVQAECNLLSSDSHLSDLKNLRSNGIGVMVYGTLAQGYLTGKFNEPPKFLANDRRNRMQHFKSDLFMKNISILEVLKKVAKATNLSMGQVATTWCLENGLADAAIIGIKSCKQLHEAAGVINGPYLGLYLEILNEARKDVHNNPNGSLTQHS